MKIVFLGTSAFAIPSLTELARSQHPVAAVVTRPDKPAGRGLQQRPSPVKSAARELGLPLLQPERIRQPESVQALAELAPDLLVVAAYGQILPPAVLQLPRLGSINLHASLLPKYRGAAPIRRALMAGERETGVTIIWMSEGLDEGDIMLQRAVKIGPEENYGSLHDRLAEEGARLLREALAAIEEGSAARLPQDQSQASLAPPLKPEESRIAWSRSAEEIYNLIRALDPAPGAFAIWRGKRLKIRKAEKDMQREGVPGRIVEVNREGLLLATEKGALRLTEVQPEGRRRMTGSEFVRGYRPIAGEVLE